MGENRKIIGLRRKKRELGGRDFYMGGREGDCSVGNRGSKAAAEK